MAERYLVWVCVEAFDEETGEGQDIDLPFASVTGFDDIEGATVFATRLQAAGRKLDGEIRTTKKGRTR